MRHLASRAFWEAYEKLPAQVRELADKNYALLKQYPQHPSLRLKKIGRYWSARIGLYYRALAVESGDESGLVLDWVPRRLRRTYPLTE